MCKLVGMVAFVSVVFFLSLHTYSDVNGRLHLATIYSTVGTGTQNKNLNNSVLAIISDAFKELK